MTWIIIIILLVFAKYHYDFARQYTNKACRKNPYIREQRFWSRGSRRWLHVIIAGVVMKYISVKRFFSISDTFNGFFALSANKTELFVQTPALVIPDAARTTA